MVHHHHYQRREIILSRATGKLLIVEAGRLKLYQLSEAATNRCWRCWGLSTWASSGLRAGAANEAILRWLNKTPPFAKLTYDAFTNLLAEYLELAASSCN